MIFKNIINIYINIIHRNYRIILKDMIELYKLILQNYINRYDRIYKYI